MSLTLEQLKEIRLLREFSEADLQNLARSGQMMKAESHSNIVIEGELSWGVFCIVKGTVGVFKANRITKDISEIAQLREGSSFGEMSLIDDAPRSATVQALTDCEFFFLSKDSFQAYLAAHPHLRESFLENSLKELCRRLRELDDHYVITQYQLWKAALKQEVA